MSTGISCDIPPKSLFALCFKGNAVNTTFLFLKLFGRSLDIPAISWDIISRPKVCLPWVLSRESANRALVIML